MTKRIPMLAFLSIHSGIAGGEVSYPSLELPTGEGVVVTGALVFVTTSYGKDRALLCRPAEQVPRDFSTCINLSGLVPESLWPGADCIEVTGAYRQYASGLIYTGSVGKEFGMLEVTKSRICENR